MNEILSKIIWIGERMKRKLFVCITCMFIWVVGLFVPTKIYAADREVKAVVERFTIEEDKSLNNRQGYVTCKVGVEYNSVGSTYTVTSVSCVPHFSSDAPLLVCTNVKSVPGVGQKITGDYVTVTFSIFERSSAVSWNYSCQVRL